MKISSILFLLFLFFSCTNEKEQVDKSQRIEVQREIVIPELQGIIDSSDVKGSILIYDTQGDKFYSNDFNWAKKGYLPASTFKITNSIIALETGVVENDSTLFEWNGEARYLQIWEQDLIFKEAFHYSCVPCYQEVARKIGAKRMKDYLVKFDYGNMSVDSTNIDLFWLEGTSQINQYQQIDFLKRFYNSKLPISQQTETIMKKMMIIDTFEQYSISGKTGWSIRNGNNNGWFVGYLETKDNTYFFATNITPNQKFNMDLFPIIRKEVTYKAFEQLGIIDNTK